MKIKITCTEINQIEKEIELDPEEAADLLRHQELGELENGEIGFLTSYVFDAQIISKRYENIEIQILD